MTYVFPGVATHMMHFSLPNIIEGFRIDSISLNMPRKLLHLTVSWGMLVGTPR